MKLIINRIRTKECSTDGILSIDGVRICDTAEPTGSRLPAGKYEIVIFKCPKSKRQLPVVRCFRKCGKCTEHADAVTKIQMAEYYKLQKCAYPESHKAEIRAYEKEVVAEAHSKLSSLNSHPCNCPRIIPGNGIFNCSDGRIIVGSYLCPGIVTKSRDFFDRLYDRIEKAIARGSAVQLVIYDEKK